jgi:hypothetical protein
MDQEDELMGEVAEHTGRSPGLVLFQEQVAKLPLHCLLQT